MRSYPIGMEQGCATSLEDKTVGITAALPKINLTNHAIERYQERVKPAMSYDSIRREIENLILICENKLSVEPPEGVVKKDEDVLYLEASPGIWLILVPKRDHLSAVTVIFDGIWTDGERLYRNRRRQKRRMNKRTVGGSRGRQAHAQKIILARDFESGKKKHREW